MDREIIRKGLSKKQIYYIAGGAALLLVVLFIIFGDHSNRLRVDSDEVTIGDVTLGDFNDYVRVSGTVAPGAVVQVTAMEGGIVRQINMTEGSQVKTGDVILTLENPSLHLQILDSEAQLAEKENFLRNTQITMEQDKLTLKQDLLNVQVDVTRKRRAYEQQKALYAEKLTPRETMLQAEEDYNLALSKRDLYIERQKQDSIYRYRQMQQMEESLENMRLNLSIVRERVNNLEVRATYDGQLGILGDGTKDITIGQNVSAGQMVGQINRMEDYKIEVNIDEHYIDRVATGLKGTFERQDKGYSVEVSKVYPEVHAGNFRTDLIFDGERPENIRVGQTYYINLQLGEPGKGILIPRGNFYATTGGKWIFVVNKAGTEAVRRDINIGRQNPQYYEVLEGLKPGERVIVSGYEKFEKIDKLILK